MHYSSLKSAQFFGEKYGKAENIVVDIGGADKKGSLRKHYELLKMKYICVDLSPEDSVDIVVEAGQKLPFANGSVDLVISTSCFEHDPCFWITFREMCRITKLGGFIYVNAPSKGNYHCYPADNWRFYGDAGQALALWSGLSYGNEIPYPVSVVETFHIYTTEGNAASHWLDFVCVWNRTTEKDTAIKVRDEVKTKMTPLKRRLLENGFDCHNMYEVQ
jgi:SAM-dependent methyltransferase